VVDSAIYAAQMYNHVLMMVICRLEVVGVLSRDFLEVEITIKVLERFFFYKSNQKVINLVSQLIVGLCWISHIYPRTRKQKESSGITYTFKIIWSLDGKIIGRKVVLVMVLLDNPLNNFSFIGGVGFVRMLYFSTNVELIKQCINLGAMRAQKIGF